MYYLIVQHGVKYWSDIMTGILFSVVNIVNPHENCLVNFLQQLNNKHLTITYTNS